MVYFASIIVAGVIFFIGLELKNELEYISKLMRVYLEHEFTQEEDSTVLKKAVLRYINDCECGNRSPQSDSETCDDANCDYCNLVKVARGLEKE